MKKIVMFDTSHGTQNMGDFIINKAINNEMNWLLSNSFVVRYSTHTPISKFFQNIHKNPISNYCHLADHELICGTNIFKYNLSKPTKRIFNINTEVCSIDRDNGVVFVGVKSATKDVKNRHFVLLLDTSGSMSGRVIYSTSAIISPSFSP